MAVSSRTFSSKTFFQFELQYCTLVSYPFVYYVPPLILTDYLNKSDVGHVGSQGILRKVPARSCYCRSQEAGKASFPFPSNVRQNGNT